MKKLFIFALGLLALAGCGKSGGGGNDAMDEFRKIPVTGFADGVTLPTGDYAKYSINADDTTITAEVEIRHGAECVKARGSLSIFLLVGNDCDGQSYRLPQMIAQSQPKKGYDLDYNAQFVHLIADRAVKSPCTGAPRSVLSSAEYAPRTDRTYFAGFGLNANQLSMATPAELHGASTYMVYYRAPDLGLAYDSATGALVGIDIPKHKLMSTYTFTVNRNALRTDNVPDENHFPLILNDADAKSLSRSRDILERLQAVGETAHGPEEKQAITDSIWFQFFNKNK